MIRFRRIIALAVLQAVLSVFFTVYAEGEAVSPLSASAEETDSAENSVAVNKIRINNADARLSVFISGEAGADVSVTLLKPDIEVSDATKNYSEFMNGVAYVNSVVLGSDGKFNFSYEAEETGLYTLRVRGAMFEYTLENNEVREETSDKMYLEAWADEDGAYNDEDLQVRVILSKKILDAFGVDVTASSIKNKLDSHKVGRRNLFIANDLLPQTYAENYIYWDSGVTKTKTLLGEFFAKYYSIGGKLDAVYTDAEASPSSWHLGNLSRSLGITTDDILADITSDSRYEQRLKPELIAAGYDTSMDTDGELTSIFKTLETNNYHIFNILMQRWSAAYLTDGAYNTIKEYFTGVKCCEYGFCDMKQWEGPMDSIHKAYLGGNQNKMGTHSSPVLYGGRSYYVTKMYSELSEDYESYTLKTPDTDFGELLGAVVQLRMTAASGDGKIMPWINVSSDEEFIESGYYYEKLFHTGLHNPDPFLLFLPSGNPTPATSAVEELNSLVAYSDRKSLNTEQISLESDALPDSSASKPGYVVEGKTPVINAKYVLSGMYAGGRNIWRITPDTSAVSSTDFKISQNPPVFKAGNETITFTNGSIITLDNSLSDIGYWVETPAGTLPEITYSGDKAPLEAKLSFYDKTGAPQSITAIDGKFDAVLTFKNSYDGKMKLIMACYDENNMLTKTEEKECGITPEGHSAIFNAEKPSGTDSIKLFLWNTEGKPLIDFSEIKN